MGTDSHTANGFDERWILPGSSVPVSISVTGALVREIQRLRSAASETGPSEDHRILQAAYESLKERFAGACARITELEGREASAP